MTRTRGSKASGASREGLTRTAHAPAIEPASPELTPGHGGEPQIADAEDRRLIAEALDTTLVVEAAAGTGKTTELVKRIVRLIETGRAGIEQIVAVTFSEKAAGELKLRLREELERARLTTAEDLSRPAWPAPPALPAEQRRALLERAVQRFEESHVSTIHGFCADLLRERPVEARIDPAFEVLTEAQSQRLWDEAFGDWIQRELDGPGEGIRRSLRRESKKNFGQDDDEAGPIQRLEKAGRDLLDWRDHPRRWTRPADFDRRGTIDRLLDALGAFAQLCERPTSTSDLLYRETRPLRVAWQDVKGQRDRGHEDYDGWEALLCGLAGRQRDLRKGSNRSGQYRKDLAREHLVEARDTLVDALVAFKDVADADLAALVHEALQEAIRLYEARKTRRGVVDFLDLLIRARDLVRDDVSVRRDFQERFRYLLVDEFQDTDPLQAELLLWLAHDDAEAHRNDDAEASSSKGDGGRGFSLGTTAIDTVADDPFDIPTRPGALFIVGDPKQSIYRFRRADVGVYRAICERLIARGARRVRLRTSFRSVPAIQRAVNRAFSAHMTGDERSLQASYVELQPARQDHAGQPAVVALPVPRPLSRSGNVTQGALKESLPEATGEFIRWLVQDSGWTVPDEPADVPRGTPLPRRPIRAGDVCLLFRRFIDYQDDVTRDYVEALEARGLTHLLVGGKAFHEREEVDALRTALTAIEWPDDQLSVFATLRGPFFALGEEELLAWHHWKHGFRPFDADGAPPHAALAPVAEALTLLRDLNRQRNHRPVAETITRLMEATRAHAAFTLWRGGEQVLANVLQIAEMARQYEAEGGLSFRGFVDELRDAAARAPTPEAPILEEGTDGVRLMTVHKAKGLEFPVVILVDMGCKLSRDEATRYLDARRGLAALKIAGWSPLDLRDHNALEASRDAAEGVRLAYVAATRAKDLLVVPAVGDARYEKGWCDPLDVAIRPAPLALHEDRHSGRAEASASAVSAGASAPAPLRIPVFPGKDTILDRPDGDTIKATTVRPGAYRFADPVTDGEYDVVWWDPLLLDRPGEERRGLRNEHLIAKDVSATAVAEGRARYEAWKRQRDDAVARGSVPSMRVMTVTEWAHAVVDAGASALTTPAIERAAATVAIAEAGAIDETRPSGARFGILVHAVLAAVPLGASATQVAQIAAAQGRMLNANDVERAAAAELAHRALRHPLVAGALEAQRAGRACRREVALSVMVGDLLVDGQADLVYDAGDRWVVVDFKSDVTLAAAVPIYARQLALYSLALPAAPQPPMLSLLRL